MAVCSAFGFTMQAAAWNTSRKLEEKRPCRTKQTPDMAALMMGYHCNDEKVGEPRITLFSGEFPRME